MACFGQAPDMDSKGYYDLMAWEIRRDALGGIKVFRDNMGIVIEWHFGLSWLSPYYFLLSFLFYFSFTQEVWKNMPHRYDITHYIRSYITNLSQVIGHKVTWESSAQTK